MTPPATARILVAEDDEDVGRFVEVHLRTEGFEVHRERDGRAALEAALRLVPDLVLLDVSMPKLDGYAVCAALRDDPRTSAAPIIMVTARTQSADKVEGLGVGADDYITKPFDPVELVARIRAALRRSRQLRDVSPLTGMPGNNEIARELDRLCAGGEPEFALVHGDLDNFKAFNDCYGFAMGDRVIKATARLLGEELRHCGCEPSFAGHVGGDDFVVVTAPHVVTHFCTAVISRFDLAIPSFYAGVDRERGGVLVHDRRGEELFFPMMSISLGVATTATGLLHTPAQAASIASEMKMVAKRDSGSSFRIDRRTAASRQ